MFPFSSGSGASRGVSWCFLPFSLFFGGLAVEATLDISGFGDHPARLAAPCRLLGMTRLGIPDQRKPSGMVGPALISCREPASRAMSLVSFGPVPYSAKPFLGMSGLADAPSQNKQHSSSGCVFAFEYSWERLPDCRTPINWGCTDSHMRPLPGDNTRILT